MRPLISFVSRDYASVECPPYDFRLFFWKFLHTFFFTLFLLFSFFPFFYVIFHRIFSPILFSMLVYPYSDVSSIFSSFSPLILTFFYPFPFFTFFFHPSFASPFDDDQLHVYVYLHMLFTYVFFPSFL